MFPLTCEHQTCEGPVPSIGHLGAGPWHLGKDTTMTTYGHHVCRQRCQPMHMPLPLLLRACQSKEAVGMLVVFGKVLVPNPPFASWQ